MSGELLVVIPALNEAENLAWLLPQFGDQLCGRALGIVVIDDGSTDGSATVAEAQGATVVRFGENRGGGAALRAGFDHARREGVFALATMDADGQHRVGDLEAVMRPILDGAADIVVGSRRLGSSGGHSTMRSVGLSGFNIVMTAITRRRVTDCSSGYRGIRVGALAALDLVEDRHHTAELLVKAARADLRVTEVPITIEPRRSGDSRKGPDWRYGIRFARTVWSSAWG